MTEQQRVPAPLTHPDCDLRDFAFMPLDIVRLFGSRFHAISSDADWRAGVTLWLKSFHQVPAGSLPVDDVELCRLAELGRDLRSWGEIKAGALYGWIRCDDGRLYHPIVAEKANEAWKRKLAQRARSQKGNEARWGKRSEHGRDHGHESEILESKAGGRKNHHGYDCDAESQEESLRDPPHPSNTDSNKNSILEFRDRSNNESLKESLKESPKDPKGQGQGQGYKTGIAAAASLAGTPAREDDPAPPPLDDDKTPEEKALAVAVWLRRKEKARGKQPRGVQSSDPRIAMWVEAEATGLQLVEAYDLAVLDREASGDAGPITPGFLDVFVAKVLHPPDAASSVSTRRKAAAKAGDPLAWATTASGLTAKGADLGIVQGESEPFPYFKARVIEAANLSDEDRARLLADFGVHV